MTAPRTIDPGRLLRALRLEVERLRPGCYRVTGGDEPHLVQVGDDGRWACDCTDSAMRPSAVCKHRLAVYVWRRLAPSVRAALVAATHRAVS